MRGHPGARDIAGRAARVAGACRQCRSSLVPGRPATHRRPVRASPSRHPPRPGQQPAGADAGRATYGHRFARSQRSAHVDEFDPVSPRAAPPARGRHFSRSRNTHPRQGARCRRRFRHQVLSLSRGGRRAVGGAPAGPAGALDRRPERGFSGRCPWPRSSDPWRIGARRRGPFPGLARRHFGQYGCLSLPARAGRTDHLFDLCAARPLPVPGRPCGDPQHLYPQRTDRRLSWRGTLGSGLCHRTPGRPGGPRAGHRSGDAAPAQHGDVSRTAICHRDRIGPR